MDRVAKMLVTLGRNRHKLLDGGSDLMTCRRRSVRRRGAARDLCSSLTPTPRPRQGAARESRRGRTIWGISGPPSPERNRAHGGRCVTARDGRGGHGHAQGLTSCEQFATEGGHVDANANPLPGAGFVVCAAE